MTLSTDSSPRSVRSPDAPVEPMLRTARAAARVMAALTEEERNTALGAVAELVEENASDLLAENREDRGREEAAQGEEHEQGRTFSRSGFALQDTV